MQTAISVEPAALWKATKTLFALSGFDESSAPSLVDECGGGLQLGGTFLGVPEAVKGYRSVCGQH